MTVPDRSEVDGKLSLIGRGKRADRGGHRTDIGVAADDVHHFLLMGDESVVRHPLCGLGRSKQLAGVVAWEQSLGDDREEDSGGDEDAG